MKPSSKQWLWAGLALAAGLGVSRLLGGPRIKKGMRVLLIGDSLALGLTPFFASLAKESGVDFKAMATVGTRIDQWAANPDLKALLAAFKPDLILVSLGTNDSFMQGADVVSKQQAQLDKLYSVLTEWPRSSDYGLGPEYVVWIGPPVLPKPPSPGISKMIQDAAGSALSPRYYYFHSERLDLPRGPDGLHPVPRGYAGWAGAIWHWLS